MKYHTVPALVAMAGIVILVGGHLAGLTQRDMIVVLLLAAWGITFFSHVVFDWPASVIGHSRYGALCEGGDDGS